MHMHTKLKHPAALISVLTLLLALALSAHGSPGSEAEKPEKDSKPKSELTGREIYKRFLDNKYQSGIQDLKIHSTDPGGSTQTTRLTAALKDNRDKDENAVDGVKASLMVRISDPFDMRHTAYLMISKDPGPDDEFIYKPSERSVRRVDLKRTPLLGTDYTFSDLAYHDVEGATYKRLPDEEIDGVAVFVVEANVTDTSADDYHRTISYIEQEHYIPIRVRYWDEFEIEIKEMRAKAETISNFGDNTWAASESKMKDLLQGTSSSLEILSLETNPTFAPRYFSMRRLSQGR
jgi:hypothetical protein